VFGFESMKSTNSRKHEIIENLENWFIIIFFLFLVVNATFSNISVISWRPVLLVEEAGVPG
jgi:hypothetical protein